MNFCPQPFNRIEIYENGDVFNCCPPFLKYYSIGNIFKQPFEEVWNSEKAKSLRKRILEGDFSQCCDSCPRKLGHCDEDIADYKPTMTKYPTDISISSDAACNVRCKICRDDFLHSTGINSDFEEKIEKSFLPAFKNAKIVRFGCSGEPFASAKEKKLIKKIVQVHPELKFQFHTNGILGDKQLLEELGAYDKINIMTVSLHSATRKTYEKIVIGGNYEKMLSNVELYSSMKQNNLIQQFRMIFVVYSENYKEMPDFVEFAHKHNAIPEFWAYRHNNTEIGRNYSKYSIIEPEHPENKKLIEILKSDIFSSESVILYPELKELKPTN